MLDQTLSPLMLGDRSGYSDIDGKGGGKIRIKRMNTYKRVFKVNHFDKKKRDSFMDAQQLNPNNPHQGVSNPNAFTLGQG